MHIKFGGQLELVHTHKFELPYHIAQRSNHRSNKIHFELKANELKATYIDTHTHTQPHIHIHTRPDAQTYIPIHKQTQPYIIIYTQTYLHSYAAI